MKVKFAAMGSDDGYGEWKHAEFDTFGEAKECAEGWSAFEDMVWVEKRVTTSTILWSSSSARPPLAAMPI